MIFRLLAMAESTPGKGALFEIAKRLKKNNIQFALGGSGLLSFFGCQTEINDWDITTDAPIEVVESAIDGLQFKRIGPSGIFETEYLFKISLMNSIVDLMGRFALRTIDGVFKVPTIVSGEWDGIPVGSPESWIKVYELLGRDKKAALLREALEKRL